MITVTHAVVEQVMGQLPLNWVQAVRWLDDNCPLWRTGPAPRGTPYVVEVKPGDDDEDEDED